MKNITKSFLSLCLLGCLIIPSSPVKAQLTGIAINDNGVKADTSAILDVNVNSTPAKRGFLLPRITTTQRNAIYLPAKGLLIYNTSENALQLNIGTSIAPIWVSLAPTDSPVFTGTPIAPTPIIGDYSTQIATTEFVSTAIDGAGLVPYIGALRAVDLGDFDLTVYGLTVGRGKGGISGNTVTGVQALANNTSGNFNVAIGNQSLYLNTSGYENTAVGAASLNVNTTGNKNTGVGFKSLFINTTGSYNIAIGDSTMINNTSGNYNTASGAFSLNFNTTGNSNTAYGYKALYTNLSTVGNTATGDSALYVNIGNYNTAIGFAALTSNKNGDYNTAIGYGADVNSNLFTYTNSTAIGNGAIISASNTFQLGNSNIANLYTSGKWNALGYNTTSDQRLKKNILPLNNTLEQLMKLNPVSYDKRINLTTTDYDVKEMGFIAQELQQVFPILVNEGNDSDKLLSVNYTALIPVLTKSIQEQQQQISSQQQQIAFQQKEIEDLKALVKKLIK